MKELKPTIGFIGAGVTGTALACQLWKHGYKIIAVNSRSISSSERLALHVSNCSVCQTPQEVVDLAQAVFITTPDDLIETVADSLRWHADQIIIHCSGVHSTDIIESAHRYDAATCCLHPLQTFASIEEAIKSISGSTFAIEGDEAAIKIASGMASAMDGNIITLRAADKVLYHAAAVTLSNYLVTLMKTAADLWQSFGISQNEAIKALLPLLKGTVNNIERVGIPGCLTGPIARGDIRTVQKHIDMLQREHSASLDIYRVMGLSTLSIALAKGHISLETADEMRSVLEGKLSIKPSQNDDFYREFGFDLAAGHSAPSADK